MKFFSVDHWNTGHMVHLVQWDTGTHGSFGSVVHWDTLFIRFTGALGHMVHLVQWDTGAHGSFGSVVHWDTLFIWFSGTLGHMVHLVH